MNDLTFDMLVQQLTKLHKAGEYGQLFELLEREQASFPEHALEICYERLCAHAQIGKQVEALQIFREALERGDWFVPEWMGEDPRLAELCPLPEFQKMVGVCYQRLEEARTTVRPELLVRSPIERVEKLPLLIGLHGNGGNARETIEHWSAITANNWLLAAPQSSQIVGLDAFVWDERDLGIDEVREHMAKISSEYALDSERVVLGGFSMGGGQAVWMALRQSIKSRGFVVLEPYLRESELEALPELLASQKGGGLRGYILVGEGDSLYLEVGRKVVEIMRAYDLPCELVVLPDSIHGTYPSDFADYVSKGLAFIEE